MCEACRGPRLAAWEPWSDTHDQKCCGAMRTHPGVGCRDGCRLFRWGFGVTPTALAGRGCDAAAPQFSRLCCGNRPPRCSAHWRSPRGNPPDDPVGRGRPSTDHRQSLLLHPNPSPTHPRDHWNPRPRAGRHINQDPVVGSRQGLPNTDDRRAPKRRHRFIPPDDHRPQPWKEHRLPVRRHHPNSRLLDARSPQRIHLGVHNLPGAHTQLAGLMLADRRSLLADERLSVAEPFRALKDDAGVV